MTDSEAPTRSTREVLESHLELREQGDPTADAKKNYSPDVVLLSAEGVSRGHDGVRKLDQILRDYVGDGEWHITRLDIEGRFAQLEWRAQQSDLVIHDGADSFVVEDGLIVAQMIHYSTSSSKPSADGR